MTPAHESGLSERAEIVLRAIDYQIRSFEALERIRWSGIALLSGIGFLALYAQAQGLTSEQFPHAARFAAGLLAAGVSIAGTIIQIRISALAVTVMSRIRRLQATLPVMAFPGTPGDDLRAAFLMPSGRTYGTGRTRFFKTPPVSFAYFCFFAAAGGIGMALAMFEAGDPGHFLPYLVGIAFFAVHLSVSFAWSNTARLATDEEGSASAAAEVTGANDHDPEA